HQLLRSHVRGLAWYRLARWRQAARHERAEEVEQEVFLRIWRTYLKPSSRWDRSRQRLRTWLGTILQNTITDLYRREGEEPPTPGAPATPQEAPHRRGVARTSTSISRKNFADCSGGTGLM